MFCSQCGKQNTDEAKFCAQCGAILKPETKENTVRPEKAPQRRVDFTVEKRVNVGLAMGALLVGIFGVIFAVIGVVTAAYSIFSGNFFGAITGSGIFILSLFTNLVVMILQAILIFQWSSALNVNIDNSRLFLRNLIQENPQNKDYSEMEYRLQSLKFDPWAFWVYLAFYFLGTVFQAGSWYLNLIGFIFLAIYLQMTFTMATSLQDHKERFYSFYSPSGVFGGSIRKMKQRNIFLLILFNIITLGIYWWYLLIVFSKEINEFLDTDRQIRNSL